MPKYNFHRSYSYPKYKFKRPRGLDQKKPEFCSIVIVGAGPVGLAAAAEFACLGIKTILLDEDDTVSRGSRSICWSKRTLEILDRSDVADRMLLKGVIWQRGRVYQGDREIFDFNLTPEDKFKMPAFINLQQYYAEQYLIDCIEMKGNTEFRWRNCVKQIKINRDGTSKLKVSTPEGDYWLQAKYIIAADGVGSTLRNSLGIEFFGRSFQEQFLITDIRMKTAFPKERRFWFNPTFHSGYSALLHLQPDDMLRVDLQLGPDADPELERDPKTVEKRIKKLVGQDVEFDLEWISIYTFSCMRMTTFQYGNVFFVGDAAHVVSPFGARGGNGGIQDVDNLVWKMGLVIRDQAPASLLSTYDVERLPAAEENIKNSTRSNDFITPKNQISADFQKAVLRLSEYLPFARGLVNSGRLSVPHIYANSPLSTRDDENGWNGGPVPGAPAVDAPIFCDKEKGWLLYYLGQSFKLVIFSQSKLLKTDKLRCLITSCCESEPQIEVVIVIKDQLPCLHNAIILRDEEGYAFRRWGVIGEATYLIRPDQHVAARWMAYPSDSSLMRAFNRGLGIGSL